MWSDIVLGFSRGLQDIAAIVVILSAIVAVKVLRDRRKDHH